MMLLQTTQDSRCFIDFGARFVRKMDAELNADREISSTVNCNNNISPSVLHVYT